MTRSERPIAPLALIFVLIVWILPAQLFAAELDEASARVLFVEARKLTASGDYAAACAKFEDSYRLDPGIGTNFNLADCYERLGRTASAWARFLDVAAATRAANQPERERVARTRAGTLEPRLSRLVVDVPEPVAGIRVRRDGILVPETAWGTAVPVDPGEHRVEASAPGKRTWSMTLTVALTPDTVSVSVPELGSAPVLAPSPVESSVLASPRPILVSLAPAARKPSRLTAPFIAFASIGVVGLATGAIFALNFRSENDQARGLCMDNVCLSTVEKTQYETRVSSAYRDRAVALIGAGVGAVGFLTAAYVWRRPGHGASTKTPSGPGASIGMRTASTAGWIASAEIRW
jgi:hypothetical protein